MAIPPILANNPLLKLFRSDQQNEPTEKQETLPVISPQTSEDIVEISEAARQRLNEIEPLSAEEPARVEEVTSETREILEEDESLTLGLDEGFSV